MSRVRFNLKNKNAETSLIIMIYRFNGQRLVWSTGCSISPNHWNDRLMRVRPTAGQLESEAINSQLDRLEAQVKRIHREFQFRGLSPSVRQFKVAIDLESKPSASSGKIPSFNQFFETFIDERTESPLFSPGSVKVYKTTFNHFRKYSRQRTIAFEDLTREFLEGFINYLYRQNFSNNYVNKIMGTMRTVLNDAWERGFHRNDSYKSKRLMVPKRQADNVYLSEDELNQLELLNLENEPSLARARDLFLIAAYTGLRYYDFAHLHNQNIIEEHGQRILEVNTQKTDEKVYIPIHPVVERILNKYGGPPSGMSNQKLNFYIKEISKRAGITETVLKRTYRGGIREEQRYCKYELVSSHTGRRSFATNAYKAGLDPIAIMKITGHRTPEQFMKYIKVDKKENALRMAKHSFFLEKPLVQHM